MDSFACDVLINPGLRQYKFGHFVLGEFPLWLVAEYLKYGLNPRTPRRGVQSEKVSSVKGYDGGRREQWGWSPLLAGLRSCLRHALVRRTASVLCLGEGQQLERGAAENSDSTNPSGGT